MKNQFRTPAYIKLNQCIRSCANYRQLGTLNELVFKYYDEKKQDFQELLANFMTKQTELNPEKI